LVYYQHAVVSLLPSSADEDQNHGRRNGFESETTEGVEREPTEAANRDA